MSTEALWIVIESVSLIQLPMTTYNTNFNELGIGSLEPIWLNHII